MHLDSIIFLHIHSQEIYINIKTPDINRLSCLNIDFTVRDIEYEISIFNSFKNIKHQRFGNIFNRFRVSQIHVAPE